MDQDDLAHFVKMAMGDEPAKASRRVAAIITLLDVCSTESLVALADALENPPQDDALSATAISLAALADVSHRRRMN